MTEVTVGAAAVAVTCLCIMARAMTFAGRLASEVAALHEDVKGIRTSLGRIHERLDDTRQRVARLEGKQ